MSAISRVLNRGICTNFSSFLSKVTGNRIRCRSTTASSTKVDSNHEPPNNEFQNIPRDDNSAVSLQYRFAYREFLPDPDPSRRNVLREKLERMDMMARRTVIDIPEFYVGSILAVTHAEPHAPGKLNKFVGICIQRKGCGLRASFILRNVVDHQGVEVVYDLYDPAVQKVECLRLEKRLDDHLLYLRDAPAEYSTFPFDMEVKILPEGEPVPINELKVQLKPQPWLEKWERQNLKGIIIQKRLSKKRREKAEAAAKPWEKYDLMKIYRETIPEEEQQAIYSEIHTKLHELENSRKKFVRKRSIVRPVKNTSEFSHEVN